MPRSRYLAACYKIIRQLYEVAMCEITRILIMLLLDLKCFGKSGIFVMSCFICVLTDIFGHFDPFGVDNNGFFKSGSPSDELALTLLHSVNVAVATCNHK